MSEVIAIDPDVVARYEPVIGLEVHAQLLTRSKAFSAAATDFGPVPNTNTDPVVLAHPGTLPVPNRRMVEYTLRMGLATHCEITRRSIFARKNYFYNDLPKGYQISQYDTPICHGGHIEVEHPDGPTRRIGLTRIHMEEDTGKSIHDVDLTNTLVDFNRAGTPLIEIVSEPDIRSAEEAYLYLMQIKGIVTYLGICSGNMEEGALRCDANVSVRLRGQQTFGEKAEVKNLNSFRGVEKAIEYEIIRQISVLESGGRVAHETRLWDAATRTTRSMRTKEQAHDYRYFPDPDLVPVLVTDEMLDEVRASLPELATARKRRFVQEFGLPAYDAGVLTESRSLGDYFEATARAMPQQSTERYKGVSNVIMTEVLRILTDQRIDIASFSIEPERLAGLVELFVSDTISSKNVKDIFGEMLKSTRTAEEISREKGFVQISDPAFVEDAIDKVLANNPSQVTNYRNGKANLFGFFVGETMKATRGQANPKLVSKILKEKLDGK